MLARKAVAAVLSLVLGAAPALASGARSVPVVPSAKVIAPVVLPVVQLPASTVLPTNNPLVLEPVHNSAIPAAQAVVPLQAARPPVAPAQSALTAIQQAAVPQNGAAAEPAKLDAAWEGSAPKAENAVPSVPSVPARTPALEPASAQPRLAAAAAAGPIAAPMAAAASANHHWFAQILHSAQPYLMVGAVLGGTWAAQKLVRWVVDGLARRGKWNPNTTDSVRFAATLVTWLVGAGVGMKMAGMATATILATYGVAITLAVRKTVANLVQAVLILVQRPFVVGDTVRIGETMYKVEDMQLQFVKFRVVGKLVKDKPEKLEPGMAVKPLKDVDPLGRDADDKGNKYVVVRERVPGTQSSDGPVVEVERFKYNQLSDSPVTLYRPYQPAQLKKLEADKLKAALDVAKRPLGKVVSAVQETGFWPLLRAFLWMAGAISLIPLLPVIQGLIAWKLLALAMPYVHGLAVFIATRNVANFLGRLVPVLFKKFGRSPQAAVVARLGVELAVWGIGLSAVMRSVGVQWDTVVTSLGVTAAAMTAAQTDVLNNFAQAFLLRLNRPFDIGDTVRVGGETGVVVEMGMFYVVLKPGDGVHTLVPYGAIDAKQLGTFEKLETKTK